MKQYVGITGKGQFWCWNKDGSLAWKASFKNAPTYQGLGYLAGVGFDNALTTKISTWKAGLIDNTGFTTGLSVNDTLSSHSGWSEFTGYSGSRPTWANSGTNGLIASNGPFTFPITSVGIVKGMFIVSTTGSILWATALLSAANSVYVGQSLTGTYSIQLVGS